MQYESSKWLWITSLVMVRTGSTNQHVIDVKRSLEESKIIEIE